MTEGIISECEKNLKELKTQVDMGKNADLKRCDELITNLKVHIFVYIN